MSYEINVGDKIPEIKALEKLRGKPFVLYFYPKDDTPGCTKQACSFRDHAPDFKKIDVAVYGVSSDSETSHAKFKEKYALNFTLIPDTQKELCEAFGVLKEKSIFGKLSRGIERTTFYIDKNGIIKWIERPVKVEGHVERVIAAIHEHTHL